MAAVARVPLADVSNLPHVPRKLSPKRTVRPAALTHAEHVSQVPFQDKENIDPLTLEGFLLFGLSVCPHCRALAPAETASQHQGCKISPTFIDMPVADAQVQPTRANHRFKKPNLRAL